jgi:hypothetical protein
MDQMLWVGNDLAGWMGNTHKRPAIAGEAPLAGDQSPLRRDHSSSRGAEGRFEPARL